MRSTIEEVQTVRKVRGEAVREISKKPWAFSMECSLLSLRTITGVSCLRSPCTYFISDVYCVVTEKQQWGKFLLPFPQTHSLFKAFLDTRLGQKGSYASVSWIHPESSLTHMRQECEAKEKGLVFIELLGPIPPLGRWRYLCSFIFCFLFPN